MIAQPYFMPALQDFIDNEGNGEAPLEGSIPDMTSSTELVTSIFAGQAVFCHLRL